MEFHKRAVLYDVNFLYHYCTPRFTFLGSDMYIMVNKVQCKVKQNRLIFQHTDHSRSFSYLKHDSLF
jgi:hypothetical protein